MNFSRKNHEPFKINSNFVSKKIIYVLCLALSFSMTAQLAKDKLPKNGSVSGKVVDAKTQDPISYATIVIKDMTDKTVTGGITDDKGSFEIKKVPEGKNIVEIQFIGYESFKQEVSLVSGRLKQNLGIIRLNESAATLDEVTVVAETSTITQKIDRKVINVGKDLTAAGTTAAELLNNVQSVSVDSQTGNISLRGNENVRVLVDGKPTNISAAQLLQQIPSTSIKQVELITNPSAKYNPEGMSGMINIILHKGANQGFNATINTGVTRGENTRFNGSIDMNYKTGSVNFFANYGYRSGKNDNFGFVDRTDNNSRQNFEFDNDRTSHLLKVGADIYINEKNTISLYTTQNRADDLAQGTTLIRDDNVLVTDSFVINDNDDDNSEAYNFNYKVDFAKEGHNLEFEANFTKSESPVLATNTEDVFQNDPFTNYIENIENDRKGQLYNIDYTNPVSKSGKLELGLEFRTNTTENRRDTDQHEFILDINDERIPNLAFDPNIDPYYLEFLTQETPLSSFKYDRDIYSAYANYNHKFKKISIQIGARLEQYEIVGSFRKGAVLETVTDEIFTIYPSTFLTYNPNEKDQFQISYSRRVDRPSLGQINPIREWSTPRITSVGNPNLMPQFTNSYEINYTRKLKNGSLSLGTFYRRVNDNITRILNIDPFDEDKVLLTYSNTKSNNRYGFEASTNYKIAKWWRANASVDVYLQKETGIANGNELEVTNNAFNARISNSFTATKNLRFQLFAMYRGGGRSIQFEIDPMWMINAGASLNVLKRKGTITFRVNDIFKGMKFKFNSQNPYPSNGQFNWESRTAFLGFMYRFNKGKTKSRSRKNRKDNETQGSGFI